MSIFSIEGRKVTVIRLVQLKRLRVPTICNLSTLNLFGRDKRSKVKVLFGLSVYV